MSVLNPMSWSLRVVSWVVTNVLDEIRCRFTDYLPSCSSWERKLLLLAVSGAPRLGDPVLFDSVV